MVSTIWFRFDLIKFGKYFFACTGINPHWNHFSDRFQPSERLASRGIIGNKLKKPLSNITALWYRGGSMGFFSRVPIMLRGRSPSDILCKLFQPGRTLVRKFKGQKSLGTDKTLLENFEIFLQTKFYLQFFHLNNSDLHQPNMSTSALSQLKIRRPPPHTPSETNETSCAETNEKSMFQFLWFSFYE